MNRTTDERFMADALEQARLGLHEGGIPIGSVLVVDATIVERGRNRRVQRGDPILHCEMDCLQRAGRLRPTDYRRSTIYTTLSPCAMCSGAILLFGIPRVVLAENRTFLGSEDWLRANGVEVVNLDLDAAVGLMRTFIAARPDVWNEDIGVVTPGR